MDIKVKAREFAVLSAPLVTVEEPHDLIEVLEFCYIAGFAQAKHEAIKIWKTPAGEGPEYLNGHTYCDFFHPGLELLKAMGKRPDALRS